MMNNHRPAFTSAAINLDLELLVFVERYATTLLKWDLLTFFGQNPDTSFTVPAIAQQLGYAEKAIRSEMGDLALLGLLDKQTTPAGLVYQLTRRPAWRSAAGKLSSS